MADQAAEGRSPSGFEIDGVFYEIPKLDEITLDEERILYIYADTVLQDFAPAHPETAEAERAAYEREQMRRIRNPEFKRALAHIAYRRQHPDTSDTDIQQAIGQVNALEVDLALLKGDDASPPAPSSQNEPSSESGSKPPSRSTGSGTPTGNSSDPAEETPEGTGITGWDTYSLPSPATGRAS
jgi:hypothetical protein